MNNENILTDAIDSTIEKIISAIKNDHESIRVSLDIDYNDRYNQLRFNDEMTKLGFYVDGEPSVRHGYTVDITWDNHKVDKIFKP